MQFIHMSQYSPVVFPHVSAAPDHPLITFYVFTARLKRRKQPCTHRLISKGDYEGPMKLTVLFLV